MILTGSALLILGFIGTVIIIYDRQTNGWSRTRMKFVITTAGLLAIGIIVILRGIFGVNYSVLFPPWH